MQQYVRQWVWLKNQNFVNLLDSLCSAHLESCIEKYLCKKKNTERNSDLYQEFSWISQIDDDSTFLNTSLWGTLWDY